MFGTIANEINVFHDTKKCVTVKGNIETVILTPFLRNVKILMS